VVHSIDRLPPFDAAFYDRARSELTKASELTVAPLTRGHLESVRKVLGWIAQFPQHQSDRCESNEVQGATAPVLEILGQPTAPVEPCEGPLDHPTSGQDLEALGGVRALDDFDRQSRQHFRQFLAELWALIAAISEEFLQEWVKPEQDRQDQQATVAILDVGWVNHCVHQQARGVDQNMPLLATDFLPRVIPFGIDAGPPFSALFTL
jgi:hypothetical protein